jgi:hypothetical protein
LIRVKFALYQAHAELDSDVDHGQPRPRVQVKLLSISFCACTRCAQHDSGKECTCACEIADYKDHVEETNVLVCRFAAGHFATPGSCVVLFAFVCAACNNTHNAEPGVVLAIVNCARAPLFLLQMQRLITDLAHRDCELRTVQAQQQSLERENRDLLRKAKRPRHRIVNIN